MQSLETIYKKMASTLEHSGGTDIYHETTSTFDPERHIAPNVAHELNNILTIVQGYADRLIIKHSDDPGMQPHLRLISEAAKRAALVVREATPSRKRMEVHHTSLQPVA